MSLTVGDFSEDPKKTKAIKELISELGKIDLSSVVYFMLPAN
jgi:hypothetical protein